MIYPDHDARDRLKVTRMVNETITMLRDKRDKVDKEDGSIAARNVIARLGKGEMRSDQTQGSGSRCSMSWFHTAI